VLDARSSIEASCARGQQQRLVTEVIHRAAAWSRDHPCARRYDATDNSTMPFSRRHGLDESGIQTALRCMSVGEVGQRSGRYAPRSCCASATQARGSSGRRTTRGSSRRRRADVRVPAVRDRDARNKCYNSGTSAMCDSHQATFTVAFGRSGRPRTPHTVTVGRAPRVARHLTFVRASRL
jgi:hypothetical protein